jgi:hypothetical protein
MLLVYDNSSFFNHSQDEKGLLVPYYSYLDFINQLITPFYWSLIFIKTCLGLLFSLIENLCVIGRHLCGDAPWNHVESLSNSQEQFFNDLKELSLTLSFGAAMIFNASFAIFSRTYMTCLEKYLKSNQTEPNVLICPSQYELQDSVVYM